MGVLGDLEIHGKMNSLNSRGTQLRYRYLQVTISLLEIFDLSDPHVPSIVVGQSTPLGLSVRATKN